LHKGPWLAQNRGRAWAGGAGEIPAAPVAGGEGSGGEKREELEPHL